jgi:hypothetical protein
VLIFVCQLQLERRPAIDVPRLAIHATLASPAATRFFLVI